MAVLRKRISLAAKVLTWQRWHQSACRCHQDSLSPLRFARTSIRTTARIRKSSHIRRRLFHWLTQTGLHYEVRMMWFACQYALLDYLFSLFACRWKRPYSWWRSALVVCLVMIPTHFLCPYALVPVHRCQDTPGQWADGYHKKPKCVRKSYICWLMLHIQM